MAAVTTEEVLDRFEREYQQYHGISVARARSQLRTLRQFSEQAGKPLLDCTSEDFAAYMSSLIGRDLKPTTVAKLGRMVTPFYSWAFSVNLVSGDTLLSIRSVKNPRGAGRQLPRPYSATELRNYRSALEATYPLLPDWRIKSFTGGRGRYRPVSKHAMRLQLECAVGLALYGGLRRSEIYGVSIEDMHPDNDYVVVRGKGDRPREVPHTRHTRQVITTWLDFREDILSPPHDQPWLSLSPNQARPGWLKPLRFQRFEGLLTPVGPYTWHRFRHTAATNWLRAGMPLEKVQRLLGHTNIQQTLLYTEIVKTDVQAEVERLEDDFEKLVNGNGR